MNTHKGQKGNPKTVSRGHEIAYTELEAGVRSFTEKQPPDLLFSYDFLKEIVPGIMCQKEAGKWGKGTEVDLTCSFHLHKVLVLW